MKESDKEQYEKRIRELEKRIRKLKKEGKTVEKEETSAEETSAGEILRSVGDMFGIGGLIKSVEKLPEFQERLGKVDAELMKKLKTTPLKRTGEGTPHPGRGFRPKTHVSGRPGIKRERPVPREREVDIFDEEDYVLAIIEIPGADEKSIRISLEKDKLDISVDKAGRKYHKEIILPCVPKGKITKTYKNGILEIKIIKN
jgi:HSP20 family protein